MMRPYVNGKLVRIDAGNAVGKGGEADVFTIGGGRAIKLFKTADHPDLYNNPKAQADATARIAEHQIKLPAFPKNLPDRVIAPEELATDMAGNVIAGYTMKFVDDAKQLRFYAPSRDEITAVFLDLHTTLGALHKAGMVVGDFTALNVLGKGKQAYLIDADSMQFGKFLTRTFTEHYVDPTHCDPNATRPILAKPHSVETDWFAFAVIVMECLLKVTPYYGGVFKGPVPHYSRPLKRITIFNPKVVYPKQAIHFKILPDDLLNYFQNVFEKDQRSVFPTRLLSTLKWQECACGVTHARPICPECGHQPARVPLPVNVVTRGAMRVVTLLATGGRILRVDVQNGVVLVAYVEVGRLLFQAGPTKSDLGAVRVGAQIHFAKGAPVVVAGSTADFGGHKEMLDDCQGEVQFVGTSRTAYWPYNGRLWADTDSGPRAIAETLRHQTRVWAGEKMGLAFYSAANLTDGFLFFTDRTGVVGDLNLNFGNAQLLDMHAVFSGNSSAWVFAVLKEGARIFIALSVLDRTGKVLCREEADADGAHWLNGFRGACANPNSIFVPTNDGVTRITLKDGQLLAPTVFTQTEDFVDLGSQLFLTSRGIAVASSRKLTELQLS